MLKLQAHHQICAMGLHAWAVALQSACMRLVLMISEQRPTAVVLGNMLAQLIPGHSTVCVHMSC